MVYFNPENKAVIDELVGEIPVARPGKMFGFPAYYAGRKLAICVYEDGVGLKLPEDRVRHVIAENEHASPFQPYGKTVMREWVQLNLPAAKDYRRYLSLFEESIAFVLGQQMKGN
jgi:hypothetical protein